jgi:iron complex outermembrane receptor protein
VRNAGEKIEFMIGIQPMLQANRNYGSRVIVPDANLFESGVFGYFKQSWNKLVVETGLRFDAKNISALVTEGFNFADSTLTENSKFFPTANGSFGIVYKPAKSFSCKVNISSGYRAPNLAELYSNGLHEGTFRWEIGDANMHSENNINSDITLIYETKILSVNLSVYRNRIFNYIYLNPTDEQYFGFSIYRYVQKDAILQGGEFSVDVSPEKTPLDVTLGYSVIRGKTSDDENLPFIPADKIDGNIQVNLFQEKHPHETFIKGGIEYHFGQDNTGQFETPTGAYTLVSAGAGTVLNFQKQKIEASVICNNLLNEAYFDALSRFKEFSILNPGRDVNLNIRIPF